MHCYRKLLWTVKTRTGTIPHDLSRTDHLVENRTDGQAKGTDSICKKK